MAIDDLKQSKQWVCWKRDPERGKIPKNPKTGGNAMSNNPATWASYKLAESVSGKYDGIGFMFANGICGIDIDGADGDPERSAQAQEIIQLMDTYTEYSPSGSGYHLIFKCELSRIPVDEKPKIIDTKTGELGREAKLKSVYYQKNDNIGVECYFSGLTNRFFTYTGEAINDRDIEDRTDQVLIFLERYMKKPTAPPAAPRQVVSDDKTDEEYFNIGLARDKKLIELWNGSRPAKNESSDDMSLINRLAYWCNGNQNLIYSKFFDSPHYKQKDEKHMNKSGVRVDYLAGTIAKAVNDLKMTAQENNAMYKSRRETVSSGRIHLLPEPPITGESNEVKFINPFETADTRRRYSWNDIGMGYLFADTYKNMSRYVPEAKSWYCYDGKVWRQDVGGMKVAQQSKDLTDYMLTCVKHIEDEQVKEAWVDFVSKRIKRAARDTMLVDAASVYPVSIMEFDSDPYIFNCLNCTLDLKNFKMHPHKSSDLLSKISNVVFDKEAKCERWESFINEIMKGDAETARFFQKALGYALTGDTSRECFFILYGATTRNGKGTSMETALYLLGDYGRTAQPETIAQKHNANGSNATEDIARLKGARFVNMSEPDKGLRLNSALVKQMTGGDTMTARYLHQNSFEFKPDFKLFINTNHLPKATDDSIFSSGRVKLIPFERHFEENEQDKGLKAFFRQPENISGIFNWFVEGLKLLESEGLEQPEAVAAATNEYRENSDTIGLFIKDCLEPCGNNYIKIQQVYSEYSRWCDDFGYGAKNKSNFIDEINKKGLYKRHRTFGYVVYDYILKRDDPFASD